MTASAAVTDRGRMRRYLGKLILGLSAALWLLGADTHSSGRSNELMAPLGIVQVIGGRQGTPRDVVGIRGYNALYRALGADKGSFAEWTNKFGFDSLGIGAFGEVFLPRFPVFSKVAWMYVDPVDLSAAETEALAVECDSALATATDPDARRELIAIRDLARKALRSEATLRFSHP